jgi:hypothetical protein
MVPPAIQDWPLGGRRRDRDCRGRHALQGPRLQVSIVPARVCTAAIKNATTAKFAPHHFVQNSFGFDIEKFFKNL